MALKFLLKTKLDFYQPSFDSRQKASLSKCKFALGKGFLVTGMAL